MHLWERTPQENDEAWSSFREWRDHVLPRPPTRTWCRERGRPNVKWPQEHSWEARALAFDQFVDEHRVNAIASSEAEMARRHIEMAHDMQDVARMALTLLRGQLERNVGFRPNELSRIVEVSTKLERLSRGLATERVEGADLSRLSDDDLAALEEIANRVH